METRKKIFILIGLVFASNIYIYGNQSPIKAKKSEDSVSLEDSVTAESSVPVEEFVSVDKLVILEDSVPVEESVPLENSASSENSTSDGADQVVKSRMTNIEDFELSSDGTGIVTKNIAKTMTEIQSYNGDTKAMKQMILKDAGAKAYGLSEGSVVDVSDKIQITDLNGLDQVSSNNLQEFHLTLTVSASDSGIDSDLSSEVIVYIGNVAKVSNWSELNTALRGTTATIIDVQTSFTNPTDSGYSNILMNVNTRPDFVLLGNGNAIDFRGTSYYWGNNSIPKKPVIDNIDLYGGNYYGPITMTGTNAIGSTITYRNVNYTGSQVTACFQAIIRFEGKNNIKSRGTTYISYDGVEKNMVNNANSNQSGLESHTLVFAENTDTTIETFNGDGVILGSYMANVAPVNNIQPSLTMEKNAKATVRTLGNSGESLNWNTSGGTIPSAISIQRNGKIDIGENAELNVETAEGTTRVPVRLGYQSDVSWKTSINLSDSSKFNINANGPIANSNSRAAVMLQTNASINVGNQAELNINARNMTTGVSVISMGENAKFNVAEEGKLFLNKDGGSGLLLNLSSGSQFKVDEKGSAKFVSTNEGSATNSMIYGGDGSSFIVGNKGTFEAVIKNGTGNRNMLEFGSNTKFQFSNAQKVDLDARGNTNVNLVSMVNPGTFSADIQELFTWNKADSKQVDPTFHWIPMYGIEVKYNGINTTNVSGNTITKSMQKNFLDNYRTENFSRVLYNYIPDVALGFDQPSDNKNLADGQKLTGQVNNNAAVRFYIVSDENDTSKDVLLPEPKLDSPVEGDECKFHTFADDKGNFSYELPSDVTLKAGQKIKAYAWLNGKDSYEIKNVVDKTPPEGESVNYHAELNSVTPTPDKFVKNPKDSNPVEQSFTYAFNQEMPQSLIDTFMSEVGEYTVKVDLSDEAGNTTIITSKLIINEKNQGLSATDFNAPYLDVQDLSESELTDYILQNSKPNAYKVVEGEKIDLSQFVTIADFGELNDLDNLQHKTYPVKLVVKKEDSGLTEDLYTTIQVKIVEVDVKLTVEFVNEAKQVLPGYTLTLDTELGETIDLTKNQEVQNQLDNIISAGYEISNRPNNESEIKIKSADMIVQYELQGVLSFTSAPDRLDFGSLTYNMRTQRIENPVFDHQLIVTDTRTNTDNGWIMTASLSSPMSNEKGQELVNALRYVNQGNETILNQNAQVIYTNKKGNAGSYVISNDWGTETDTDGIKLQIDSSDTIYTGDYTGVITWKVMAGQP